MHALTQSRGFQNAITFQNSSFGNDGAKRSEISRGVFVRVGVRAC